jgi:hypothetical protein
MKLAAVLFVMATMVGCATKPATNRSLPLHQLQDLKYTNADCRQIDQHIEFLETQLRGRGLYNADPERLTEPDRVYNATARIYIWNLRIGCANPKRFAQS